MPCVPQDCHQFVYNAEAKISNSANQGPTTSTVSSHPDSDFEMMAGLPGDNRVETSINNRVDSDTEQNSETSCNEEELIDNGQNFRAEHFAQRIELSKWFHQILSHERNSWRLWLSKRSISLGIQTVAVGGIFVINFILTLFGIIHYPALHGIGTIREGDCNTTKRLDLWLHLLINVLSTGMLMGSNYCMQLLAAVTRAEIDKAHAEGQWLDIGVPSLRNLCNIGWKRKVAWLLLGISSLPVHLLYNSAVFSSLTSSDYTVAVVNNAFLTGGKWNLTSAETRGLGDPGWSWVVDGDKYPGFGWRIPLLTPDSTISAMQQNSTTYQDQNVTTCFNTYSDYFTPLGNLIVVVKNDSVQSQPNDTLLIYASVIPNFNDWAKNQWAIENGTEAFENRARKPRFPIKSWYLGPEFYEVNYCLVQTPYFQENHCRLQFSSSIMITICALNLTKTLIMFFSWLIPRLQRTREINARRPESRVIFTLGDAISSFMSKPDETTKEMSMASKNDFQSTRLFKDPFRKKSPPPYRPMAWEKKYVRWMSAASCTRWTVLILVWAIIFTTVAVLLVLSLVSLKARHLPTSIPALWELGFGAVTTWTYLSIGLPASGSIGLISNALVANLPQLCLSVLYLFCNAMLSCLLVQHEFSQMSKHRKPLRVSEPQGIQRSSYFISLPLRYGLPLCVTSSLMHWLSSQSFFLAHITAYFPDGTVDEMSSFSTCAFSPIATFFTILAGVFLAICLFVVAYFFKYDKTMPVVATNSRAISAACQTLEGDQQSGYLLPVKWGVVERKNGYGRCSVSTACDIKKPSPGLLYA